MVETMADARRLILDRLPALAGALGWTNETLRRAAAEAAVDEAFVHALFPGGVLDALAEASARADEEARRAIEAADLASMRVRERIAFAVKTRIAAERDRDAVRRAALRLAAPDAVGLGPRLLGATADVLWRAVGDRSTDVNFYTKRMILAGIYAGAIALWAGGDDEAAWRFLDRRIDGVMRFEKVKAALSKAAPGGLLAAAVDRLGRLRYRS